MRSFCYTFLPTISFLIKTITVIFCLFLVVPIFASAATLSFTPSAGSYAVGSTIMVSVVTGSGGTALNAVSGTISFPKDLLEVVSIQKSQSIVSLWVQEPLFSNTAGSVQYEGIILNPGYTGAAGKIITIHFKVKSMGVAALSFSAGSILANDGSGTEILSNRGTAQYQLIATPVVAVENIEAVETTTETETSKVNVNLTSTTNPPDGWSHKTSGVFDFTLTRDVTSMRLLVDDKPDSMPVVVYTPPIARRTIDGLVDGVSYLHVQYKDSKGWGEVLHYKLQIDTAQPENLKITLVDTDIFYFKADDKISGIAYYEVQVDGGETITIAEASPVYRATGLEAKDHTLLVKAFDRAGNYAETSFAFSTPVSESALKATDNNSQSVIANSNVLSNGTMLITILSVVIPCLALLMLMSALLFFSWRSFGGFKKKLDKEIYEARSMVHRSFTLLKADLEVDINTLEKASAKRKLTREELKILKRLQKNIEITEHVITKEVADIETKAGL